MLSFPKPTGISLLLAQHILLNAYRPSICLEFESLKPEGEVQCMFVEKWQVVQMKVLTDAGVWYRDRQDRVFQDNAQRGQVAEEFTYFPAIGVLAPSLKNRC